MNCRNCGLPLSSEQKFCPNCGSPVNAVSNVSNGVVTNVNGANNSTVSNVGIPSNIPTNFNNQTVNVPTNFNTGVNVNEPGDIGFNRNLEQDLSQFGNNNPYANRDNMVSSPPSSNTMQMHFPEEGKKRKFPWFIIAICLVVVMVGGLVGVPLLNSFKMTTYESDEYKLEYNGNWTLDEEQDKMTLYYSDKDSRFLLNAVSTFASLNFAVDSESAKQTLYKAFYDAWSNLDGGELTGGTDTFLTLNDETMYARIDYKMSDRENIGAFYVIVSEENDKVISFMSYCTEDNWNKIDKDILKMLDSIIYKSEADSSFYDKFTAGGVKEYSAIGYMDYKIPDCWSLDEERTKNTSYKSYIFKFRDGVSLLDIKGVTPYNSATMQTGTTYEAMKATIIKNYGEIKSEDTKTINGKTWYIVVTPDYTSGNKSYHNEIYFTLSASNKHLYYLEAYVSNDTSKNKTTFFNESIEYILESIELYKVDE